MKKAIISVLIFTCTFISLGYGNLTSAYNKKSDVVINKLDKGTLEQSYITELERISNQLDILSSNALDTITNKNNVGQLLKDASYIKTQIRNLRAELSEYHKTESGNIEKNPLSLSLLNTLNYYSMSLSYMQGFLEATATSDASSYLERYYTNKGAGDELLLWDKKQLSE